MHMQLGINSPSFSAKTIVRLSWVYLYSEIQEPGPGGFNHSPYYVVNLGVLFYVSVLI